MNVLILIFRSFLQKINLLYIIHVYHFNLIFISMNFDSE